MKKLRTSPIIEETKASFRVTVCNYLLDEKSQKVREDICKMYNKSRSYPARYTIPKTICDTAEEAMDWFVSKAREEGLELKMQYNHKDIIAGMIRLNDDGTYCLELAEREAELIEVPKIIEIISDPLSDAAKLLVGQLVQVSKCAIFDDVKVMTLEKIDPRNCRPFSGHDDMGNLIEGGYIREYVQTAKPLDLSDPEVRDMLRGKWLREKATGKELMVGKFSKDSEWVVNGNWTAEQLMRDWELIDGTFLGVEA